MKLNTPQEIILAGFLRATDTSDTKLPKPPSFLCSSTVIKVLPLDKSFFSSGIDSGDTTGHEKRPTFIPLFLSLSFPLQIGKFHVDLI